MNRLGRFSSVVKSKSAVVKEKMINYIKNEQQPTERSVSCGQYLVLLVGFDVREKMRPVSIARSLLDLWCVSVFVCVVHWCSCLWS